MTIASEENKKYAWLTGAITQAVVVGFLLFVATFELFSLAADAQLFRYQGF